MIKLVNIKKCFGNSDSKISALSGINLCIEDGELIGIIGPSGSGKSTLLNIIGCLDKQTSGEYYLNNQNVGQMSTREMSKLRNSTFGFIVQDFALINEYSVYQNVILPIFYNNKNKKDKREKSEELLKRLQINEKIDVVPTKLSGGQKQRVAIARALINDPEIILADEPTGALDQRTGQEVIDMLKEINKNGKTVIIITHDLKIAEQCNRIIKIVDGVVEK